MCLLRSLLDLYFSADFSRSLFFRGREKKFWGQKISVNSILLKSESSLTIYDRSLVSGTAEKSNMVTQS